MATSFSRPQETLPLYCHHWGDIHHLHRSLLARSQSGVLLTLKGTGLFKSDFLGVTVECVFHRSRTIANMPLFPGHFISEMWDVGLNYNKVET